MYIYFIVITTEKNKINIYHYVLSSYHMFFIFKFKINTATQCGNNIHNKHIVGESTDSGKEKGVAIKTFIFACNTHWHVTVT